MTDAPPPSDPSTPPAGGGGGAGFCGECGAKLDPGSTFCGSCGTATPAAVAAATAPGETGPAEGASNWTGVQPIIERPGEAPTEPVPAQAAPPPPGPVGPPPAGAGGPPSGPPGGPPPEAGGAKKGKGPLIALVAVLVAALAAGAFFVLGGDDDEAASDDTTTTTEEDPDDTTTTEVDDTTTTAPDVTTTTVEVPGVEFVPLTDATGRLTVEVPSDWTDVSLARPDVPDIPNIQASTDLAAFRTAFEVPGMSFSLLGTPPEGGFDSLLDFLAGVNNLPNACVSTGKQDYDDGVFVGRFEVWEECANIGTQIVLISAAQADGQTIEVSVQLPEGEPIEIAQHIAETFFIVG